EKFGASLPSNVPTTKVCDDDAVSGTRSLLNFADVKVSRQHARTSSKEPSRESTGNQDMISNLAEESTHLSGLMKHHTMSMSDQNCEELSVVLLSGCAMTG